MGWTFYGRKSANPKLECDKEINESFKADSTSKHTVLASAMVGSTYYAAVEAVHEGEPRRVFAAVFLTSNGNKDGFGYKDMDESMGPCETKCPVRILDTLTPTKSEYAVKWRAKCRAHHAAKRAKQVLQPGQVVVYVERNYRIDEMLGRRGAMVTREDGAVFRMTCQQLNASTIQS